MEAFIFGGFGLIVGSFLNVLILREGSGRTVLGRSSCASCGRTLLWFDLIPVASWLFLKGKCRQCSSRISVQYPIVEAATCILFALIGFSELDLVLKILGALIVSLYIAIFVYDLYHTLIPDYWSYAAAALAFLYACAAAFLIFDPNIRIEIDVWQLILSGPAAALPLFSLWFISRGAWMGLGDVKLALSIGWLLGPWIGIIAILGAFVLGALISICILLPLPYLAEWARSLGLPAPRTRQAGITSLSRMKGPFTMQSEVPFGPFLIASCLLFWFLQIYGISSPLLFLGFY